MASGPISTAEARSARLRSKCDDYALKIAEQQKRLKKLDSQVKFLHSELAAQRGKRVVGSSVSTKVRAGVRAGPGHTSSCSGAQLFCRATASRVLSGSGRNGRARS